MDFFCIDLIRLKLNALNDELLQDQLITMNQTQKKPELQMYFFPKSKRPYTREMNSVTIVQILDNANALGKNLNLSHLHPA